MTKEQVLHNFWSSFSISAFDENSVPSGTSFPYITYNIATSDFDSKVALSASLWYKSTSWKDITEKLEQINEAIGFGGKMLSLENGSIWIKRGTPFSQRMSDENDSIRRILINVEVEYISMN